MTDLLYAALYILCLSPLIIIFLLRFGREKDHKQ